MVSLYVRANPRQRKIFRIVEGSVRNTLHAHPDYQLPESAARSIAKRAAGTLTASWPEVLAIPLESSERSEGIGSVPSGPDSVGPAAQRIRRGSPSRMRRPPLFAKLYRELSWRTGEARYKGHSERAETLIEILRLIDRMEQDHRRG